MAGPKYRVKLYGHTSPNEVTFVTNLAVVLAVTQNTALKIVRSVPVFVRRNLEKEQADKLVELLGAIRALCIAESENPSEVEAQAARAKNLGQALGIPGPAEGADNFRFKIWSAVLMAAACVMGVFVLVTFFMSYAHVEYEHGADVVTLERRSKERAVKIADSLEQRIADAEARIDWLKSELDTLRSERDTAGEEVRLSYKTPDGDPYQMRKKKQALHQVLVRITDAEQELKNLEPELWLLERRLEKAYTKIAPEESSEEYVDTEDQYDSDTYDDAEPEPDPESEEFSTPN